MAVTYILKDVMVHISQLLRNHNIIILDAYCME